MIPIMGGTKMNDIIALFGEYFSYPFIRYAFICGILIALCSSLAGVILVLKRYSFMGDGLSHVAFGALAIATVLKINNEMIVVMPVTVLCAILLLASERKTIIKGDSALAMLSVGTLAIGYLLMNVFPVSSNINGDVCGTLFGSTSILTLSNTDVKLCAFLSVAVIVLFITAYDKIFAVTFDENFAAATGINVGLYNAAISIVCAVIIVLAMNLAGSLLTSALIVFPAISAMRIFKSFKKVVICSAVFSIICTAIGISASIILSSPVGCTVVAADIIAFFIFSLIGKIIYK